LDIRLYNKQIDNDSDQDFRFRSLCKYAVDQGLKNHGISYMERQTDNGEYKIDSFIFRLVTPCVSAEREARYKEECLMEIHSFLLSN